MLTITLLGGAGNQMFQVATLISHAIENHNVFVLERKPIQRGPIRGYNTYWDSLFRSIAAHCKANIKESMFTHSYRERGFPYHPIPPMLPSTHVRIQGYFQSYKYFHHHRDQIKDTLKLDVLRNEVCEKYPKDYENTISLHFRVGDYAKLQHFHPLAGEDYYSNALNHIMDKTQRSDWNVLVFFEEADTDYVASMVNKIRERCARAEFAMCDHGLADWEHMLQMSLCRHNIIANSTFSWWGGYLNERRDHVVCYPSKWFNAKIDTSDLCPPDWVKING